MADLVKIIVSQPTLNYKVVVKPVVRTYKIVVRQGGGSGGGLFSSDIVMGEIPNGLINGSNATFTSFFDFIPEKLIVERNGVTQRNGIDYTTTGTNTINLTFSPEIDESILINYIKL